MDIAGVREVVDGLADIDVSVADHGELADVARGVARLQAFADAVKVQIVRRTRELAELGDRSADHVLMDEGRLSGRDARANSERDRVCGELPGLEQALAGGEVTGAHLDALARHTKGLTDEERADLRDVAPDLIDHAVSDPVELFDRKAKGIVDRIRDMHRPGADVDELDRQREASYVKRWTDQASGLKHTMLALDPVRDASLWTLIDHHLTVLCRDPANAKRPFAQLQVDAVLAALSGGDPGVRVPEIVVHVDAGSLCHGRHGDTVCETIDGQPVPVSTAQRMCCEAILQAVIVNPDGTVDRLCAEQRTASRKQRRMLAAMYATCAHPHCQVGFSRCRIHHIVWWIRGGRTVLANLLPLCETHHHLVHEGGWTITMDAQRRVTWTRPDGTVWLTDTGPNRVPEPAARTPDDRSPAPQCAA